MRTIISIIALSGFLFSFGQVDSTETAMPAPPAPVEELIPLKMKQDSLKKREGMVRYIQDEGIKYLDEYLVVHPIKHDGYRIQLVFGSRETVAEARSKYLAKYDYSDYQDYLPPNFRLRVGDFMNRIQAEKALRELREDFPDCYVVKDKIEVPKQFR